MRRGRTWAHFLTHFFFRNGVLWFRVIDVIVIVSLKRETSESKKSPVGLILIANWRRRGRALFTH